MGSSCFLVHFPYNGFSFSMVRFFFSGISTTFSTLYWIRFLFTDCTLAGNGSSCRIVRLCSFGFSCHQAKSGCAPVGRHWHCALVAHTPVPARGRMKYSRRRPRRILDMDSCTGCFGYKFDLPGPVLLLRIGRRAVVILHHRKPGCHHHHSLRFSSRIAGLWHASRSPCSATGWTASR